MGRPGSGPTLVFATQAAAEGRGGDRTDDPFCVRDERGHGRTATRGGGVAEDV